MPLVGSLNLCLKMPDSMKKESVRSDNPATTKSDHIFDVFSGLGDRIELIPFALSQAS